MADAAFSVHTVYFMPDPTATFSEVARALRTDGIFVVGCRTSDTSPPAWMDPDVYRIPTARQLITMLTDVGFDHVHHHTVETPGYDLHLFAAHLGDDTTA